MNEIQKQFKIEETRKKIRKLLAHCLNNFPTSKEKAKEYAQVIHSKNRINFYEFTKLMDGIELMYFDDIN